MAAVKEMFVLLLLLYMKYVYPTKVVGFIDLYKFSFAKVLSMLLITIVCFICFLFFAFSFAYLRNILPESICKNKPVQNKKAHPIISDELLLCS
ncbi:hypothetical protein [Lacibacter sp.]|uniref:hypothetical protein n=1 Tax=Lacibacter sp. TaxID=1915409 RepID=UPI002B4AC88B|nr:hypothetical protein [Lacibacter sp.]HLP37502.1 hypothetical protein [Lacibacter sp.]